MTQSKVRHHKRGSRMCTVKDTGKRLTKEAADLRGYCKTMKLIEGATNGK
jgi:hypothetical protein